MQKFKEIMKPALLLTLICIIVTALLAVTFSITDAIIKKSEQDAFTASCKEILPEAVSFTELNSGNKNIKKVYTGKDANGKTVGYVFTSKAKGYGGDIEVMTGINKDGTITNVKILTANETPGLGAKAADESYIGQYRDGKDSFKLVKREAKEGEVTAITGATITSKAVTDAVNAAIVAYKEITEG